MSLPFFDAAEDGAEAASLPATLAGQERVKLKILLTELEGLKKKLHKARRKAN
jgi:hypothetical protein